MGNESLAHWDTPDPDARLRLAIDEAGLATWDADLITGETFWSPNHFSLFGYPVEPAGKVPLQHWTTRLHPDDRERVLAELRAARLERTLFRCEHRIVRADTGETVWIEPRGRFIYDPNGRAVRMVGVCLEITSRKEAEERLVHREAQLELAARIAGIGIFDHDHTSNSVYWSDRFREIHRVPPGVEPNLPYLQAQAFPEDRSRIDAQAAASHDPAGDGDFSSEYRIRVGDGEVRWIVARAQTFFSGEGADRRPVRTLGTELDVTERKRIEVDLREERASLRLAQQALHEADRRKDQFLATLAHELRNPLAPIRTAAQLLALPSLGEDQLAWSRQVIHRQVEHMARLLDDLLDVARITRGKLHLKKEPVNLGTIVDTAVEAARPLIAARMHRLTVELPPQRPLLDGDPVRLAQIISNLLTNAAKYTDPPGRIELSARVEGGRLRLCVRDNGIGLAPGVLGNIFEMFSQVETQDGRTEGGLGIGLALVKGLVELHGGTIEAFSDGLGCGSEFAVTLPCRRATSRPVAAPPPAPGMHPAAGKRVLVADDNEDAANSLAMLLRVAGHEVRTAHGGQAALAAAREFAPDVVLLDIGMPDLNGYDVARTLRQDPSTAELRLIALTGWGQDEDKRRAHAAGFDHHLTKPVDLRQLDPLLTAR